jgi:alpha-D-xyloside xylohydrolase
VRTSLAAAFGIAVLGACGDNIGVTPVPLVSGAATVTLAGDNDRLIMTRHATVLVQLRASAFQIGTVDDLESGASFDPYYLYVDNGPAAPDGFAWHEVERFDVIASSPQRLELELDYDGGTGTLALTPSASGNFAVTFAARADSGKDEVAYLRVQASVDESDAFYGLGEWPDGVEHRGKLRPMQIEADTTLESSNNENHVPVPLLIGTRGWGVFAKSVYPGVFDVARESATQVDIAYGTGSSSKQGLQLFLFTADEPLDVLASYYEVTGVPGLPAEWAYGPLLWRDENTNQAEVLDDIQQIRTRDLATSGIWFDRPYATGVNTFDWDATKFPAPTTMLAAVHAAGLRYGIWSAPYVAAADNDQDQAPAQHDYAEEHGFFPPVVGVTVNQWGKPIDFTNPDAYAWWQQNLRTYTDTYGVEGFKLDYGEDVVLGLSGQRVPWRFADGSDERTMQYGYTLLYHKVYRDLLNGEGAFLLTRTGRWGDQTKGMIIWPGDLAADLSHVGDALAGSSSKSVGGLPTALAFGIGLSASGFPFFAADTGGYRRSPPSLETFLRWTQASSVWSAMQVGNSSDAMPWELATDTASLDIYRRYARLHMRLFPYTWSYAKQMGSTGHPIVRPFGLAYPQTNKHPSDQYLLGEHLFVAPVITPGATTRTFFAPPGEWLDWWTGAVIAGGQEHTVPADLATLPLYIQRGGIVPMLRDTIDTLAPTTDAAVDSFANDTGVLAVRIAPGGRTSFRLFDGSTIVQTINEITYDFELHYMPSESPRFTQGVLFEVIATAQVPARVLDGTTVITPRVSYGALQSAAEGWFWDSASMGGTLWIKVPGAAVLTIE